MKVTTLLENSSLNEHFVSEHGLSLYIKTEANTILFDTGKTDAFLKNAEKLNLNLKEVDTVIISHGHYDHIGGLIHFLNMNQKATVYLKRAVFDFQYVSIRTNEKKNIGYPTELLKYKNRCIFLENTTISFDNLHIIPTIHKIYTLPKGNNLLYKQNGKTLIKDDFEHELVFAINTTKGIHLFSGCAHNGILNMVSAVKSALPNSTIKTIMGGFHLVDTTPSMETETDLELTAIARELKRLANGATYYTGHCTGQNASKKLAAIFKNHLQKLATGKEIII